MSEEERFKPAGTLPGKIFVPAPRGGKKHPCAECFECQWCPDSRCAACRGGCARCARGASGPSDEGRDRGPA